MPATPTARQLNPLELIKALRSATSEFRRYVLASAAALGCDVGLLFVLTQFVGLHYLTSGAISYCTGAVLHYVLCVTLVFRSRAIADRRLEFIAFFVTGLLGLGVTQVVLKVAVDHLALSYLIGKVAAVGLSFTLNFLVRKVMLFTLPRAAQ